MKAMKKPCPNGKCPYEEAIRLVGNVWSLQIIKELHLQKKPVRFNEFLRALKPISSKTLSAKLKELTKCGVIKKEVLAETPVLIQYSLTGKGQELTPILDDMAQWTLRWRSNE
jgi:DNA-binding HxlR family transcriptional regulator